MSTSWNRKLRRSLAGGALACLLAGASAWSQSPTAYYQPGGDDVSALRQRVDALTAQLEQMRNENRIHTASLADEKKADDKQTAAKADDDPFKKLEVVDKPTIKVGGRLFADHLMIDQDDDNLAAFGDLENRSRFDTARIEVSGLVNEIVDYKLQFDFQGDVSFKDAWITVMQLPVLGNLRVGHMKEPFSLDELTSSRFITFMERSSAGIFTPGRRYGMMAFNDVNENPDLTWFAGGFREGSDENSPDHQNDLHGYSLTSRIAWLPYYDEPTKGRYLIHLGAAASYRMPEENVAFSAYSRDPGINIASATFYRTGGLVGVDDIGLGGLEAAIVAGPLSIQAEWYAATVDQGAIGDSDLQSAYVYVSYFLTGENRGYNRAHKAFDRVTPFENFFRVRTADGVCCGRGAWELAARYSYVDLIDGNVNGTRGDDFTLGVNWYLNPYTRMMFNWVHADVANLQGVGVEGGFANLYGIRFQVDF